jgi:hypothetical protein
MMIRLMGLCFLAAAMTMVLRQMNMAAAGLLCTAFGVLVLGMMLPDIREYVRQICKFLESMALEAQYGEIMLRAVGIVLLTQFSAQICRDMDAPSVAKYAEMCGRLTLLGLALPVFLTLTQMAVDVLR